MVDRSMVDVDKQFHSKLRHARVLVSWGGEIAQGNLLAFVRKKNTAY
jgi:hypothetical protein